MSSLEGNGELPLGSGSRRPDDDPIESKGDRMWKRVLPWRQGQKRVTLDRIPEDRREEGSPRMTAVKTKVPSVAPWHKPKASEAREDSHGREPAKKREASTVEPWEGRPKCQCSCGCQRSPGKGGRRYCVDCNLLIGPGCCYDELRGKCHQCVGEGGANPPGGTVDSI